MWTFILTKHMEKIAKSFKANYNLFVYGIDCWAGRFEKRVSKLENLNFLISISSFTSEQIRKQNFEGKIIYLPPVLDEKEFPAIIKKRSSNNIIKFITVGRLSSLEKYKGHDQVIEAMKLLTNKQNIKNTEYNIVGKGDDKKRLEQKVNDLKLNKYVKFYGFVPDEELTQMYILNDVFIMPSKVSLNPKKPEGEGFGIVFIEAAMYELPLIGPNNGGSKDIIENGVSGLECDPTDSNDIANKMKILINDVEKRTKFGENAKKKVLKNFTLKQLDSYLEKLFI